VLGARRIAEIPGWRGSSRDWRCEDADRIARDCPLGAGVSAGD